MSKRFTATEIWDEDWFLDMPCTYKLFWFYVLASCDHAGLFRVNLRSFCGLNEVKITTEKAIEYFNSGKDRIRIINQSVWLIEDFFVFQYGHTFNPNNRMHESVEKVLLKYGINMTSIRGLLDLKDRVKDKDKDIYNDSINNKVSNSVKDKKENNSGKKMIKPSIGEIKNYFIEIGLTESSASTQSEMFLNHYESNGWKVGKNSMKDWKATCRSWKQRIGNNGSTQKEMVS